MPQDVFEVLWIFFIYAMIGWTVEVIYATVEIGKFVNRGFLNGPYCPIYGCGVLIVISLLYPLKENNLFLFIGSFLLTSIIEYFTGLILEKVFKNKWWDYSDMPFNIQGYVCLKFSIFWGLGCMFIVDIVHPGLYKLIHIIPNIIDKTILSIIVILFIIDLVETILDIIKFNKKILYLDELAKKIKHLSNEIGEDIYERTSDVLEITEKIQDDLEEKKIQLATLKEEFEFKLKDKHRSSERLIKAFPNVKSIDLEETLEKYKDWIKEKNNKKKE